MALSPEDFSLSISRSSFRALLITCKTGDREMTLYAEALPDSPDHDWSIPLDGLRHWTRPVGIALTAEELESLSSVLAQHFGVEGFRVRWADLADQAIDALRQLGHASADRIPRREVMMAVDLARTSLVMLVAIPGTPFWLMCLLVGSVSLLNPVFKASQLALLPDVLPGGRFAVGMAIRNMTVQSAQLLGFAGGGLLVAALNPRAALVIDGLTFLASALLLRAGLRPRPAAAVRDAGGPTGAGWLRSFRRAGGLVVADTGVRTLFLLVWLMAVIAVYEGLAAPYTAALGGGSAAMGLLLAGDPLGGGRRGVRG